MRISATNRIIAYALNAFPRLSETFILNEIWELKKRGIGIFPIAMYRANEKASAPKGRGYCA